MRTRLLLNLVLLVALIALGLYAYYRPQQKEPPGLALATVSREAVERIRVEPRSAPVIELARRDGQWHMLQPYHSRVDAFQVDRLLDITTATSKQRMPRENLARFELDPPRVSVSLNDQPFAFGAVNELTNEQYVATADGVYVVAPHLGYGVPTEATKLISHRLLADNEPAVGFDFGRWQATKDDAGKWILKGQLPSSQNLSQDELNRWADEWKLTSSLAALPYRGPRSSDRVSITVRGGKTIVFDLLSRAPQVKLVRTDERTEYRLGADAGRRLLDPWSAAAKN